MQLLCMQNTSPAGCVHTLQTRELTQPCTLVYNSVQRLGRCTFLPKVINSGTKLSCASTVKVTTLLSGAGNPQAEEAPTIDEQIAQLEQEVSEQEEQVIKLDKVGYPLFCHA